MRTDIVEQIADAGCGCPVKEGRFDAMRWTTLALVLAACGSGSGGWVRPTPAAEPEGQPIRITGVVRHLEVEGGVYVIRGDDDVTYNPTNLPPEFRRDGLQLEAEARRRDDLMGIHQVGPLVQLERIRKREPPAR